jgi:hypothetical protein
LNIRIAWYISLFILFAGCKGRLAKSPMEQTYTSINTEMKSVPSSLFGIDSAKLKFVDTIYTQLKNRGIDSIFIYYINTTNKLLLIWFRKSNVDSLICYKSNYAKIGDTIVESFQRKSLGYSYINNFISFNYLVQNERALDDSLPLHGITVSHNYRSYFVFSFEKVIRSYSCNEDQIANNTEHPILYITSKLADYMGANRVYDKSP